LGMRTVLVFPPLAWPFSPYLSLPALSAYLKREGREVVVFDANVRLFQQVFTEDGLRAIHRRSTARFGELDSLSEMGPLEEEEYLGLARGAATRLPLYFDRAEQIRRAFQDPSSYRMRPDGGLELESAWFDYQAVRAMALPDSLNPLDLPVLSLRRVRAAIDGEAPLPYSEVLEGLADEAAALGGGVVGLSIAFGEQVVPGLVLASMVKRRTPDAHVVVGGSYFASFGEDLGEVLPELGFVDSVVAGEGEGPLAALAEAVEAGRSPFETPGLAFVRRVRFVRNEPPPPVPMDELPVPDFGSMPLDQYFASRPVLPYATARGCYYGKCAFCNFARTTKGFRVRDPDLVARDLDALSRRYDALFYLAQESEPPRRMRRIAEALLRRGAHVGYQLFARFEKGFTDEVAERLARSGCLYVFFGLESGSERVNRLMRKGVDLDEARAIVARCAAAGLNVVVSSIRGFPTESDEDWRRTLAF